jgi:hypothetical protein
MVGAWFVVYILALGRDNGAILVGLGLRLAGQR